MPGAIGARPSRRAALTGTRSRAQALPDIPMVTCRRAPKSRLSGLVSMNIRHGASVESVSANRQEIGNRLRARGIKVVLLTPNDHPTDRPELRQSDRDRHLNAAGYDDVVARTLSRVQVASGEAGWQIASMDTGLAMLALSASVANGTKRTCISALLMSAFDRKADIAILRCAMAANDPQLTNGARFIAFS